MSRVELIPAAITLPPKCICLSTLAQRCVLQETRLHEVIIHKVVLTSCIRAVLTERMWDFISEQLWWVEGSQDLKVSKLSRRGISHIPFPRSRPTALRAASLSHQGPSCLQILLSSHFPENWETFGAHMEPAETEFADRPHRLRPDNPVMSHLDSVISTELGFGPSPSVRTGSADQTAWALNRCKKDCDSF